MKTFTRISIFIMVLLVSSFLRSQISITYTSNGTFTVPVGVTEITVECWGAGGGGGRSTSTSAGRGGGGGGAYARSILTVSPNQNISYTIGTGGNGASTSSTASTGNGGSTIFGSNLVVAVGGGGVGNNNNTGGAGGLASACTFNDVAYSGGNGSAGSGGNRGAGGGGAGSTGAGGNASGITAGTGTGNLGGNGGAGSSSGGAGTVGANYGGGGGGAKATTFIVTINQNGGNGAPGAIRVTYMPPNCSGQPNAGTASISASSGCDNANFTLSATGLTLPADFQGISYQWQSSTNGGSSWQNISGATNTSLVTTAAVNTLFRLQTSCSSSGQTNVTNSVSYTVNCWTLAQNKVVTTCGGNFFDSGGSGANYGSNQNYTYTFFPANPGEYVTLTFTQFTLQSSTCSQDRDWLRVFNGNSTSATALHPTGGCVHGFFTGQNPMPAFPYTITSTAPDGSLTVQFKSDGSTVAAGWAAQIGCVPSCSGTPNAGTATISAASGCPSTSFTLNATGISTNPGVAYQWQTGPSISGPWVDISGATSAAYSTTTNVNAIYRLKTTCTNSNQVNYSSTISRTVQGTCTCTTYAIYSATDAADSEISSVTVGTMTSNVNTCSSAAAGPGSIAGRYSNFTTTVTGPSVAKGSSVNFSLTQTSCGGNFGNGFQIYVDWNQNGTFEVSERMYTQPTSASGTHTKTGSFTVPLTALTGTTRMRIVNVETTFPSTTNYAITDYTYGETEDYCFTVLPPPPSQFGSSWFSMNTGSAQWCPNETRTVSVTVTNTGTLPWTDSPGNDFNIGVKWNYEGDYIVRVDAENLAVGQSKTYFLTVTAPNNPGGTENLTFDVVKEGCFWFASNADGCSLNTVGPNNTTFVSPQIILKYVPLNVSAGSALQLCPGTTGQLSGNAISPIIPATSTATNPFEHAPTELNASPTIASVSSCPLELSVNVPAGAIITAVNISYTMENTQLIPIGTTGQRSYLECTSPGGQKEAALTNGTLVLDAIQTYTRNNLTIANGVTTGGTINFRLHGFRISGGSGCTASGGHRVNQNSVVLTVIYTYQPTLQINWNASPNLSATNILNPTVSQSLGTTTYTMNVSAEGCSVSSNVNVQVGNFGCTQLINTFCGITDVSMSQILRAVDVNAAQYRFKISGPNNGGPGWNNGSFIYDAPIGQRSFRFQFIPGSYWGQTYSVEVATGDGLNNFGPFGTACNVSLANTIPISSLEAAFCGATVSHTTDVFASLIQGAQAYRFRINGGQEIVKTQRNIKMNEFGIVVWGQTYSVDIAVQDANGNWGAYGAPCSITVSPTTQLEFAQCNITNVQTSTVLKANGVNSATSFRFRITGPNNGGPGWVNGVYILNRPDRTMRFNMIPGSLQGEQYTVEVSVSNNGLNYSAYGPICNITLFGTPQIVINDDEIFVNDKSFNLTNDFMAITYPNPMSADHNSLGFGLKLFNANDFESIEVVIYDMSGKLIENQDVHPNDLEGARFGSNMAAGIYMVQVTQGTNRTLIRQIKK